MSLHLSHNWATTCSRGIRLSRALTNPMTQQTRGMRMYQERTIRAMYWRGRSFDRVKYEEFKRSDWQEWNYRSEIFAFSRRLQENLSEDTLRRIFAHQSYLENMQSNRLKLNLPELNLVSNDEMIEQGENLLDATILPYLRHHFSQVPEEGIVSICSYLKSEAVLSDTAKWIGCKDIILTQEWPPSPTTMASTVKALVAGIEKDLGFDRVQRFVVDIIISYLNDKYIFDDVWILPNPKETLSIILSHNNMKPYEPRIVFQTGLKTMESCHMVGLYSGQKFLGISGGETIQIAEECAALDALERIFDLSENRAPFVYGEASERIDYNAHKDKHDSIEKWKFQLK